MRVPPQPTHGDPPLVPRSVEHAPWPMPYYRWLFHFVRNPLRLDPSDAYREQMVIRTRPHSRTKDVWVSDPDLVEKLLVHQHGRLSKSEYERRVLMRIVGDGVLTAEGRLWQWQRGILAPLFRPSACQDYVPAMTQAAEDCLTQWRAEGSGRKRVDRAMADTTFSVIVRTMLADGECNETERVRRANRLYFSGISWEIAFQLMRLPSWIPCPGRPMVDRAVSELRSAVGDLAKRRRAEVANGGPVADDVLSRLLAARDPASGEAMNETQIVNNLLTLLEAGHETTAVALTWCLYLLSRSPDWQEALRAEVGAVAGGEPVGAVHVPELVLTSQVFKEAMRLFPPGPTMARVVTEPFTLGGQGFAPGDVILIPVYCIHRHQALWRDPDRFDPTRFTVAEEATRHRTQYIPFGLGPRACVGGTIALLEAVVILATLVRGARVVWSGRREPEPVSRVTLRPRGGMALGVELL